MDMVTVRICFNPAEAQLLASRLRAEGLMVYLHGENAAHAFEGYAMGIGGIRIQVPENQVEDAKALLDLGTTTDSE